MHSCLASRCTIPTDWSCPNNQQPTNLRSYLQSSWSRPPTRQTDYDPLPWPPSHTSSPPRRAFDRDRDRDWGEPLDTRDRFSFDAVRRGPVGDAFTPDPLPPRRHFMPASSPSRDRLTDRDVRDRGESRWNERRDDRLQDDMLLDR